MKPKSTTKTKIGTLFLATTLLTFLCRDAKADSASYTFEEPKFTLNEHTPLLNRAPNSSTGAFGAAFLTTFTASPGAAGLSINDTSLFNPNGLFSGQFLYVWDTSDEVLTMSFDEPVTTLDLDFSIDASGGFLRLITSSGSLDQPAVSVGGGLIPFGGHASFSSLMPFTSAQVEGFDSSSSIVRFAIDNATLTVVPEPTTSAMFALGLSVLFVVGYHTKNTTKTRDT